MKPCKHYASAALVMLLFFAFLVFSGGCGGSSSSNTSDKQPYMVVGTLSDLYKTLLDSADSTYTGTTDIIFGDGGLDLAESDPTLTAQIKSRFNAGGRAVLLASHTATSSDISRLAALLGLQSDDQTYMEHYAGVQLFGCEKEEDGDIHVFVHNNNDAADSGDVTITSAAGLCAFRLGNIVKLISGDDELTTTDVSIDIVSVDTGDRIVAQSGDVSVDCVGFADLDARKAYTQSGDRVYEHDIQTSNDSNDAAAISSSDMQIAFNRLVDWTNGNYEGEINSSANGSQNSAQTQALKTVYSSTLSQSSLQQELAQLAKDYKTTFSVIRWGKSLVVNFYVISCHSFDGTNNDKGGQDLYFFKEEGILDGSANYRSFWAGTYFKSELDSYYNDRHTKKPRKHAVLQGEVRDCYIKYYCLYNEYLNAPTSLICHEATPVATNNTSTTTTTCGWNIGGSANIGVKFGGGKNTGGTASLGISGGYNTSTAFTFSTEDVTASLTTAGPIINGAKQQRELKWTYEFKSASGQGGSHKQSLYDPALLSHTVFNPINTWIWQIDTKDRTADDTLKVTIQPVGESVFIRNSGSASTGKINSYPDYSIGYMALPHPPLVATTAPVNVSFDKNGGSKTFDVFVQGEAEIDDYSLAKAAGVAKFASASLGGNFDDGHYTLTVQADPNHTGKDRAMGVTIYRRKNDGTLDKNDKTIFYIKQGYTGN